MVTIVTMLAMIAALCDLRKNVIPNRVLLPGMGIGFILRISAAVAGKNLPDIFVMAAEVIALFICLWPIYAMGGLGAGDCKLFLTAGVFLPVKQAVFVVTGTFFIAAAEIVLVTLFYKIKKRKKRIRTIRLAPAFFVALLIGWL